MKKPEVGQEIYVGSSFYVYRGEDDFHGGKAKIASVHENEDLPEGHFNRVFVTIEGRPSTRYNYTSLMNEQDELKEEFGDTEAHAVPDYREEFNQPDADWH